MLAAHTPLVGFAAYSGTGKTTLLEKIIPELNNRNINIAVIKHAHHDFDIDYPGKDSYRLRHAGANQTIVASNKRWALIHENRNKQEEPNLFDLLDHLDHEGLDLILIEGFKHESIPRIELHRKTINRGYMYPNDENIIAIATDSTNAKIEHITQLDINNPNQIVDFIFENILKK